MKVNKIDLDSFLNSKFSNLCDIVGGYCSYYSCGTPRGSRITADYDDGYRETCED